MNVSINKIYKKIIKKRKKILVLKATLKIII